MNLHHRVEEFEQALALLEPGDARDDELVAPDTPVVPCPGGVAGAEPPQVHPQIDAVHPAGTQIVGDWLIAATGADTTSHRTGTNLPVEVVDHLDTITDRLRRMDDHIGGTQTLDLVRQHLTTVIGLLENRRYDDTVGRRLHTSAAELLRLA